MADEHRFHPVVYRDMSAGLGLNYEIRSRIFGGLQYRPVVGTPLGRVLSQNASLWNMRASRISPGLMHRQGGANNWGQGFYWGVNPLIAGEAIPNRSSSILAGWAQGQVFQGAFRQSDSPQDEGDPVLPGSDPGEPIPDANSGGGSDQGSNQGEEEQEEHNYSYPSGQTVAVHRRSDNDNYDPTDPDLIFLRTNAESLFRDLREYFENPYTENEVQVSLFANCLFCNRRLEYTASQDCSKRFVGNITGNEYMEVLPCGHIVGQDCMYDIRARCMSDGTRYECPVCKLLLTYQGQGCRHPVSSYVVDRYSHFPPLTIPEGGRIPRTCAACNRDEELDPRRDWAWTDLPEDPFPFRQPQKTELPIPANAMNQAFYND
ncbi:hypothetical protein F4774DRAFT_262959 [Daldinia eschscholtzii]|nr:hypothetical protein F4774DRAFT_262959 [Daldinia eschscholtzii]